MAGSAFLSVTDGQRRCINTRVPLVAASGAQGDSERRSHDGATGLTARAPKFFVKDRHCAGGERHSGPDTGERLPGTIPPMRVRRRRHESDEGFQAVSGSDVSMGRQAYEVLRPEPRSCYVAMRFGPFYVGEPDSNRPANFSRLVRFVMRKGKSREDAEDLVQEAMLHLHMYSKGHTVVNEEAFLRRAIHNLEIDQYRRDRFGLRREVSIQDVDREHPLIAPGPTPDRILDSQQRLDEITVLLDAVNTRTREVYLAHRFGYTYAEIASDMGIANITIKRHIARANVTIMSSRDRNRYARR
jgi:RNA polymerase sigma factor (sigma-70 family)